MKIRNFILLAAICLLVPACGASGGDDGSGPSYVYPNSMLFDVRVDGDGAGLSDSTNLRTAQVGAYVYAVWEDDRNGEADIYFNRSINNGTSWGIETRLDSDVAGAAASTQPAIAARGGNVYVVWADDRSGGTDIYFQMSADGGATWLPNEVRVDTDTAGAGASTTPDVACTDTDVHVVWEDARSGSTDIRYQRYELALPAWLVSDVRLDSDTAGAAVSTVPQVEADTTDVVVVWQDMRAGNADLYSNHSTDSGANWAGSDLRVEVGPAASNALAPEICMTGTNVYVVWTDNRTGTETDIYFQRSTDAGATWAVADARIDVSDPAGISLSENPCIECFGAFVYIAWADMRNGGRDIYYNRSLDSGATWPESDRKIDNYPYGAGDRNNPRIITEDGINVFATWHDSRIGSSDIYVAVSLDSGEEWSGNNYRMDTDFPGSASSLYPQIGLNGTNFCVVWQDHRNGLADIRANRSSWPP